MITPDRQQALADLDEAYRNLENVLLEEIAQIRRWQRRNDRRSDLIALAAGLICATPLIAFLAVYILVVL